MKKRIGESIAATFMWIIFGVGAVVVLVAFPLLILRYAILGTEDARNDVKLPGKALDQLFNSFFFAGNPKETLSSHAGRWLSEAPERAPWWAHVVDRITGLFEENHVFKAIEKPFIGLPL